MILYYVRHGEPTYQPDELTPIGLRQAESVGRRLARYGLDRIFASSSNRAIQTAQPAAEMTRLTPVILDWCNESHAWRQTTVKTEDGNMTWGFQHAPTVRLFRSREIRELGDKWYEHPAFANTSFKEGILRVDRELDAWLLSLGYRHDRENGYYIPEKPTGERVALFAHQGFGMLFMSSLLGIPYPEIATSFDMNYTGVTVINFEPNAEGIVVPKALEVSSDAHLWADGLPTEYNRRWRF